MFKAIIVNLRIPTWWGWDLYVTPLKLRHSLIIIAGLTSSLRLPNNVAIHFYWWTLLIMRLQSLIVVPSRNVVLLILLLYML